MLIENKPPEPQENPINNDNNNNPESLNQALPDMNQNTNIINNNTNNNNIINNNIFNNDNIDRNNNNKNKEEKIFLENTNKISTFLIDFSKREKNKQLDELISDLKFYKEESKNIKEKDGFTESLYEYLQKNLIELSFLKNNQIKQDRMHKIYLWYKNKRQTFEDLKKIATKSYKEKDEFDDLDVLNEKEQERKLNMEEENLQNIGGRTLEDFYKHRNKEMLFKDMLDDYKRKHLNEPYGTSTEGKKEKKTIPDNFEDIENTENIPINEKQMYKTLSMTSFKNLSNNGEMSTFYSTRNGQNSFTLRKDLMKTHSLFDKVEGGISEKTFYSLFNKDNKTFFPPLNRETKFSYSFNRPIYNYYSVYAEKKIIQNKMKNLAEKRSKEEIDEKMEKYGFHRAKYKEGIINKYELRDIVNMYANMNEFKSPLLEKYKYNKVKKEKENKKLAGDSKLSADKSDIKSKHSVIITKKDSVLDTSRQVKRSQSCAMTNFYTLDDKQKLEINKVKNIDINSKSILESNKEDIKVVKMKLKQPKDKINTRLLKYHENSLKIPSDVIPNLYLKNALFKNKMLYNDICGVEFKNEEKPKEVDTGEDSESEYHNFYMSAYDFGNLKKIESYKKINNRKNNSNSTRNKIKKQTNEKINKTFNINKDNFLNFRKTMSSWKKKDFEKLCKKISKEKEIVTKKNTNLIDEKRGYISRKIMSIRQKKQNSLINAMVNPIEDSCYARYFLPRSGSMLLKRNEPNAKKTKKGKRKK